MAGRRRHPRYLLNAPIDGTLRVREDVTIEEWHGDEVSVISCVPSKPQERLTLEMPGDAGEQVQAVVQESRPIVTNDGSIRHRLRLVLTDRTGFTDTPYGDRNQP